MYILFYISPSEIIQSQDVNVFEIIQYNAHYVSECLNIFHSYSQIGELLLKFHLQQNDKMGLLG